MKEVVGLNDFSDNGISSFLHVIGVEIQTTFLLMIVLERASVSR